MKKLYKVVGMMTSPLDIAIEAADNLQIARDFATLIPKAKAKALRRKLKRHMTRPPV